MTSGAIYAPDPTKASSTFFCTGDTNTAPAYGLPPYCFSGHAMYNGANYHFVDHKRFIVGETLEFRNWSYQVGGPYRLAAILDVDKLFEIDCQIETQKGIVRFTNEQIYTFNNEPIYPFGSITAQSIITFINIEIETFNGEQVFKL